MELFDFGIMGEKKMGTDFWCYIKEIDANTDAVKVVTEDCDEIDVEFPRFEKHGNIMRRLGAEPTDSLPGIHRVIASLGVTPEEFFSQGLKTFHREYNECMKEKLNESGFGERAEDTESSIPLCIPNKDLMHNRFVRLVQQDEHGRKSGGAFTVGVCYPVLNGCLLDDEDSCAYDNVHSVDEINKWDNGHRTWEAWDERKPSCFME